MSPCPCGYYGDITRECRCTPGIIQRYPGKIGGPLLYRIDIQIEMPAVPFRELRAGGAGARNPEARGYSNSRMPARMIRKQCALDETGERTLEMAMRRMSLSALAHDRILKVARTVELIDTQPG